MLRGRDAVLYDLEHPWQAAIEQRRHVQPQTGKNAAAVDPRLNRQTFVLVAVQNEPIDQVEMLLAVLVKVYGGRHMHDSFDQLGFHVMRHGLVTAMELLARQMVTLFEPGNYG